MRTVVQRAGTEDYLTSDGGWSADPLTAMEFKNSLEALDYCCRHKLWEAVLVLKFEESKFDILLHPFHDTAPEKRPVTSRELPHGQPPSQPAD